MAECPQCMFANPDDAAVCDQCGAELGLEVLSLQLGEVCRDCDSYNEPGTRVCVSCGKPLSAAASESAEAPSETPVETPPAEPAAARPVAAVAPAPAECEEAPPPQPWLAPPSATPPPPARGSAPLPPGALPPGWAAYSQKSPPQAVRAAPLGAVRCSRCQAENLPTARFCGTCGLPLVQVPGAQRARGKLIVIHGRGEGRQVALAGQATVGRHEGTLSFPDDVYVAPLHATFLFRGDELVVRDEGAANGIYVRLKEARALPPGAMFAVGERLLRYAGAVNVQQQARPRYGAPRLSDRLHVIEELLEGGVVGRVCKRPGPIITVGRGGCDLNFPADGFVSARHAELSFAGETAFLRDLGSANGTFLRVQPGTERALAHGDYLIMGRELLRVELSSGR